MNLLYANDLRGRHPDSWYAATAAPLDPFPPLDGDARADVCIVGGGFTGLSAALHMAERGLDVRLVEAHRVGFGASGRNGGQVGSGQRQDQVSLEARQGHDDAQRLWQLGEDAKALVQELARRHGIDARWRPGVVEAVYTRREVDDLQRYAVHLAQRYGYEKIETLDRAGIAALTGSDAFAGGYVDRGAGHIHPLRFAFGLAEAATAAGARLHEGTEALRLAPGRVETASGAVTAEHVVLAANGYVGRLEQRVAARVMPINNYIVATQPLTHRNPEILPGDEAVADSLFVVNYWRKSEDGRLLFGGGESYGYRFPADIAALVRKPMLKVYPQLAGARIDHAWGGTLGITPVRLPHFARLAPGLWSASGYSGHGVALATLAGRLLAAAIAGDTARFDVMARLAPPAFPGGTALRKPILVLAMAWFAMRDRLGV